jgi:nicotinate dehydrogenase subunit B
MAARRTGSSEWSQWVEGGVLAQANQVDDWITIQPDGTITVYSGKVELGTGVKTALAQIVAEELDVPFERIKMVMGDTALTPDEGYTAGSTTIQFGGFALRQASAEARQALLEIASDRLDAALDELTVRDGLISVSHHPGRTITYAELLGGKKFQRRITLKAPLKRPEEYRIVGQPIPRVDLPRKISGAASFVHDVRLPRMRASCARQVPARNWSPLMRARCPMSGWCILAISSASWPNVRSKPCTRRNSSK